MSLAILSAVHFQMVDTTCRARWVMDLFGNWRGVTANNTLTPSRMTQTRATPQDTPVEVGLALGATGTNEMTMVKEFVDGTTTGLHDAVSDAMGNLVSDGTYRYQFDAWCRLVQVERVALGPTGDTVPAYYGRLLKHFTYDGLGRLVRCVSPYPSPDLWTGLVRSERYYYDGARRVQEVAVAGLVSPEDFAELEVEYPVPPQSQPDPLNPNVYILIPVPLDTSVPPLYVEQGQLDAGTVHVGLVREYVWGTGDGFAGVDELLAQFDEGRQAWWVLQDASGDIIAQVKSHPRTGPPEDEESERAIPSLAARYDYDAYGKVTGAWLNDALGEPVPPLSAGHKGLFFDNLNENRVYPVSAEHQPMVLADLLLGVREQRHTTWAEPVYHVRNRNLMPRYGRWLQRDMNATGQVTFMALPYNGNAMSVWVSGLDVAELGGDGVNLHQYVGNNAWRNCDPTGLMLDTLWGTADNAMRYQQAYENAKKGLDLIKSIVAGVSVEQAVLGLLADLVADKLGDKMFEPILRGAKKTYEKSKKFFARRNTVQRFGKYDVRFDDMGFPDLTPHSKGRVEIRMTGTPSTDRNLAIREWEKMGRKVPPGHTWHHDLDLKSMHLVPTELNQAIEHLGGASVIRDMLKELP